MNVLAIEASWCAGLNPILVGVPDYDPDRDRSILEKFLTVRRGSEAHKVELYLRGRIAQRSGHYKEAIDVFEELVDLESRFPEPALRLGECLRATGFPNKAEERLRALLANDLEGAELLATLWATICFADLQYSPADMLRMDALDGHSRTVSDLRWLVNNLASPEPIRINCGGGDYTSRDGSLWASDRFYCLGFYGAHKFNLEDGPLYQTMHWFDSCTEREPLYAVPLPRGTYKVTLFFCETVKSDDRRRAFRVSVEDRPFVRVETKREVVKRESWTVEVLDGVLDIKFGFEEGSNVDTNPSVSAIEIKGVEGR